MEHLSLEIFDLEGSGSQYAVLPDDCTVTLTVTSRLFSSGNVWSHSFRLNAYENAHIFGTAGDLHGSRLHDVIDKRRARLWAEGVPLYLGQLRLGDEEEVDSDGNFDVTFESGMKTFEAKIEGAKANQVPLMSDVRIGVALWRKRWTFYRMKLKAYADLSFNDSDDHTDPTDASTVTHVPEQVYDDTDEDMNRFMVDGEAETSAVQEYPRMVWPKGDFVNKAGSTVHVNELNTDYPYTEAANGTPTYPFCNVALCYQKYGYDRKLENGDTRPDYSSEPEAQRGYEYMPANRVNSAPNFFVIYWLRCLMKHIGIHVEENQMMDVEDLRRLFFVNTRCDYREPKYVRTQDAGEDFTVYKFKDGMRYLAEQFGDGEDGIYDAHSHLVKPEKCGFKITNTENVQYSQPHYEGESPDVIPKIKALHIEAHTVEDWTEDVKNRYESNNSFLHDAYATSKCFPDADIAEVIKAIESGFGVRFLFDANYQRVRIVLLRNIFRSNEVQHIECNVIGESKVDNCIRGFRMTYGDKTSDTHFYYKGFADLLPHKKKLWINDSDKHDYSHWKLDADYASVMHKISAFDKTCYVTPVSGNAYGIKVDKDAKRYDELHQSLFEFAGFMDAEDGDCTGDDETISTVDVNFVPAIMNDLNMEEERKSNSSGGQGRQVFALFVDETMRPRRPSLEDGKDYNDSDAVYKVDGEDGLYGNAAAGQMKSGDVIMPGCFALTSDVFVTKQNLSTKLTYTLLKTVWDSDHFETKKYNMSWDVSNINIEGHINEGYRLYLQDNYEPNDDGICPIETHDWGLMLGIMRGSGSDARVVYSADPDDHEGNDTWELKPGNSVTAHPDTCDSYGREWDYNGSLHVTSEEAAAKLSEMFHDSDAPFNSGTMGYITETTTLYVRDDTGRQRLVLIASGYSNAGTTVTGSGDIRTWSQMTLSQLMEVSQSGRHMVVEVDSSPERGNTLVQLCGLAYGDGFEPIDIDNGVGARYGRFSLKLRAEKPNPEFDPEQPEGSDNRRYLAITNENLRRRGLADQFYKEYSYWVRNARIARKTTDMELAQLLAFDDTVKMSVGDVTGFMNKMQVTISNKTGLAPVDVEILYI